MNGFSLAWRSVIRKPIKSVLLFVTVFTISLLLLSGMSSGKATIQMQDNTRQAIGAGILLEENEADFINGDEQIIDDCNAIETNPTLTTEEKANATLLHKVLYAYLKAKYKK